MKKHIISFVALLCAFVFMPSGAAMADAGFASPSYSVAKVTDNITANTATVETDSVAMVSDSASDDVGFSAVSMPCNTLKAHTLPGFVPTDRESKVSSASGVTFKHPDRTA